jgi:hypothetical protein
MEIINFMTMENNNGFINNMILLYKEEGTSPERLQHDLFVDYKVKIEWDALMARWNRL